MNCFFQMEDLVPGNYAAIAGLLLTETLFFSKIFILALFVYLFRAFTSWTTIIQSCDMSGRSPLFLGITCTADGVNESCSRTQHDGCGVRIPNLSTRKSDSLPLGHRAPTSILALSVGCNCF